MRGALTVVLTLGVACGRDEAPAPAQRALPPQLSAQPPANVPSPVPAETTPPRMEVPPEQTYLPANLKKGERRPLLLVLHGYGASGKTALDIPGLLELAKRERLFLLAPDGTLDGKGRRFWNAHPACCNFEHKDIDDVTRLATLLASWKLRPNVDPRHLYVVEFSNGGFMAHRLACEGGGIAGIVSIGGAVPSERSCGASLPRRILEIHGTADDIVRYEGGTIFGHEAPHAGARETLAFWRHELNCVGEPTVEPKLDLSPGLAGAETERLSLRGCKGAIVALWSIGGGDHYSGLDPAFMAEAWRFLLPARE